MTINLNPEELQESGILPPKSGYIFLYMIASIVITTFVLLITLKVNVTSDASGKVIVESKNRSIKAPYEGRIEKIHVKQDESIAKNQAAYTYDLNSLQTLNQNTEKSIVYLEKEIKNLNIFLSYLKDIDSELKKKSVFISNLVKHGDYSEINAFKKSLILLESKYKKNISLKKKLEFSHSKKKELLQTLTNRQKSYKDLLEKKYMSQKEYEDQKVNILETELEIANQEAEIGNIESLLAGTKIEMQKMTSSEISAVEDKIFELNARLDNQNKDIESINNRIKNGDIKSPIDGTVLQTSITSSNEFVSQGQVLAIIVPNQSDNILEVKVKNTDIGFITLGKKAIIRVDTFPFEHYGVLEGVVTKISADSFEEDDAKFHLATIKIQDSEQKKSGNPIKLETGYTATASIILRKRKLIDYFLEPVIKYGHLTFEKK